MKHRKKPTNLLNIQEAAEFLDVELKTLRMMLMRGRLPDAFKTREEGGSWLIPVGADGRIRMLIGARGPSPSWAPPRPPSKRTLSRRAKANVVRSGNEATHG